ncbi:M16 family metallopeptidase [Telmatospirillum siberiense]|uniref:Peptidase M16 n=1 Tax=Telmatospirillum siberiense TaxID=382514 RepID=A0A2N3PNR5_9PROT|nr:pitrilysin family protein [Telmatospirillum siberiense]PKU22042.1 peptidase M16 [Telmatospirillum siberiense]
MKTFFRVLAQPAAVCFIAGLSIVASATAVRAQIFNPETFTLKNGMQVVVIPNHRVPVLSHMVYYKVGAADETPGKTGLAHMVEHMMFKGTKAVPAGVFSQLVAKNGGRDNAFTTADFTAYYQNVAADKLELVMKLESDRMANLSLKDADFLPERQVVIEERRMRIDNAPAARLNEQLEASLFLNSPYHHPVIGWRNEIEKYTLADVVDFHHRWYAPNNAILLVSGDITVARLKPLAEKYYGVIPARAVPPRQRTEEPPPIAARTVELRDPEVHQPNWQRLYLAPSYLSGETRFAYPLQILGEILGGGSTSRLYRSLVVERKLAAMASAGYDPGSLGPTSFSFDASPLPGISMEDLQAAMLAQIRSVVTDGVSAGEVEQAKRRLQTSIVYAKDSYSAGARVLGAALAGGRRIADAEAWPQRIAAVSTDEVNEAARFVLRDEGVVTGLLLPSDPLSADARAATPDPTPKVPAGMPGRELR